MCASGLQLWGSSGNVRRTTVTVVICPGLGLRFNLRKRVGDHVLAGRLSV